MCSMARVRDLCSATDVRGTLAPWPWLDAWVSTRDQNPDSQTDALAAAGRGKVFVDHASGVLARRAQLDAPPWTTCVPATRARPHRRTHPGRPGRCACQGPQKRRQSQNDPHESSTGPDDVRPKDLQGSGNRRDARRLPRNHLPPPQPEQRTQLNLRHGYRKARAVTRTGNRSSLRSGCRSIFLLLAAVLMGFYVPAPTYQRGGRLTRRSVGCRQAGSAIDDLWDAEVLEAFGAELQAVAGLLRPTEGHAGVHGAVLVDPHGSGLDACGDLARGGEVGGPD